jgi:hypothetical protein
LVSGIAGQQIANEPGGDRWVRLIDEIVDAYADRLLSNRGGTNGGGSDG